MALVSKFFLLSILSAAPLARGDECSPKSLSAECVQENASKRKECLEKLVALTKRCTELVAEKEDAVLSGIARRGSDLADPLTKDFALSAHKLEELREIMAWHTLDMLASTKRYVAVVKDFQEMKNSATEVRNEISRLNSQTIAASDVSTLSSIRVRLVQILRGEQGRTAELLSHSDALIAEFERHVAYLDELISGHKSYLDAKSLTGDLTRFVGELGRLRQISGYYNRRSANMSKSLGGFLAQLDAKMIRTEQNTLAREQKIVLRLSTDLQEENAFYDYISTHILATQEAPKQLEALKIEYAGEHYRSLLALAGLEPLCRGDNEKNLTTTDWMRWGCARFHEFLPRTRALLDTGLERRILRSLKVLELDDPARCIPEKARVKAALDEENLSGAADFFDLLLDAWGNKCA